MTNIKKYLKILRYLIIIIFFPKIFISYNYLKIPREIFLVIFIILISNDVIRSILKKNTNLWYYISLSFSIFMAATLKYFTNSSAIHIYMFLYIIEILYIPGRIKYFFLALHSIFYLIIVILSTETVEITPWLTVIGMNLLSYLSIICILYLSHAIRNEREETKKLNEELKLSNIKLKEYSLQIEELSVTKERQRVAQELHDSLGHSLMALTMHLEFAEKIFDTKPEKAKEVILKAKNISKNSISSLRTAVNTLKEERNIEDLSDAIYELIDNFKILGNIKINLIGIDKNLEILNPDIKLCVYKTIRESLTNGLRHGKITAFRIEICIHKDSVNLSIKDNGIGCKVIIKSNGLKGIEDRIIALGGTVYFNSRQNCGFLTKVIIPIYSEVK